MIDSIPSVNGKKIKNIWWDETTQELVFDTEEEEISPLHSEAGCLEVDDITDYENLPIKRLAEIISGLIHIDTRIINKVYGGELKW